MRAGTVYLFLIFSMFGMAARGSAQSIEVGGSVAVACVGSEGSLCAPDRHVLVGAHTSWWVDEGIELGVRLARTTLPSYRYSLSPEVHIPLTQPVDVAVSDRSREFVSLFFVYHFLRGSLVRPMLGLGAGWYRDAARFTCQPIGCDSLAPGLIASSGDDRNWQIDVTFLVGLSSIISERWVVRGGWQPHRFGGQETSTYEWFAGAGYRF